MFFGLSGSDHLVGNIFTSSVFSFAFLSTPKDVIASIHLNSSQFPGSFCEIAMPLKVRCDRCGTILYEGRDVKPPYEIIQDCEGKCPHCHRKLSYVPKAVEVLPIE